MKAQYPDWKEYVKTKTIDRGTRPNFEADLQALDIDDAIGKEVLIKGKPLRYDTRFNRESYYIIRKRTPKQISVTECSVASVDRYKKNNPEDSLFDIVQSYGMDYNITADKFYNILPNDIEFIR